MTIKNNSHLNVEICNSVTSVKYIYIYVYKGHDKTKIAFNDENCLKEKTDVDEITNYLDARYVSA